MEVPRRGSKDEDIENNNQEINLDYERDIFKRLNRHIEPMKNPMIQANQAPPSPSRGLESATAAMTSLPPPPVPSAAPSSSSSSSSPPPSSLPSQQQPPPPAPVPKRKTHQSQSKKLDVECADCDDCEECAPSSKCVCKPYPCKLKDMKKVNWKILLLRICIAFILCALASGLGAAAFLLLRNIELNTFQQQFASATDQIKTTVTTSLKAKFVANSLVQNIFRYGIPTGMCLSPPDIIYLSLIHI